tara:strand:+ start:284 stop:730 length:447 start_codon:yes stop_codon:yes gene_type:complete
MSIITKIDGVPLFSTKEEALRYARLNNIVGYHTHTHFGKVGYMGGKNHLMEPDISTVPLTEILAQPNINQDPRDVLLNLSPTDEFTVDTTTSTQVQVDGDTTTDPSSGGEAGGGSSGEEGGGGAGSEGGGGEARGDDGSGSGEAGGGY